MGFSCSNWTFAPSSVAWRFSVAITIFTPQPLSITRSETWDPDRQALKFELGAQKINLTMWLQNFSIKDDQYYGQRALPYTLSLADPGPGLVFSQSWQYSRFSTLIYDPDFALLVTATEPTTASPPAAAASASPFAVAPLDGIAAVDAGTPTWVPIVVVIAVLVVAAVILIVGLVFRYRRDRKAVKTLQTLSQKLVKDQIKPAAAKPPPTSFAPPAVDGSGTRVISGDWTPADSKRATLRNARGT
jgi:hypothetical protein